MKLLLSHFISMVVAGIGSATVLFSFYELKYLTLRKTYATRYEEVRERSNLMSQEIHRVDKFYNQRYGLCLQREKKLTTQLWVLNKNSKKDYQTLIRENKKRYQIWQRKKKQEHRPLYLMPLKNVAILEKFQIESKSESQTL